MIFRTFFEYKTPVRAKIQPGRKDDNSTYTRLSGVLLHSATARRDASGRMTFLSSVDPLISCLLSDTVSHPKRKSWKIGKTCLKPAPSAMRGVMACVHSLRSTRLQRHSGSSIPITKLFCVFGYRDLSWGYLGLLKAKKLPQLTSNLRILLLH
jgi:hypothetical protein